MYVSDSGFTGGAAHSSKFLKAQLILPKSVKSGIQFWVAVCVGFAAPLPVLSLAYGADTTAIMTSAEATDAAGSTSAAGSSWSSGESGETDRRRAVPAGVSRAGLLSDFLGGGLPPIHFSTFSMLLGPAINNFSSGAPTAQEPFSGFSVRHEVRLDCDLSDTMSMGPSFDVMQNLYTSSQSANGQLILNDPSLRLAIKRVNHARLFGLSELGASIWLQVYAPVSTFSREIHEYTAISAAYIPTLDFRGSRFSLSGVGSIKINLAQNMSQTGTIAPTQIVAAIQGAYRLLASTSVFLMNHVDVQAGPPSNLPPQALAQDNFKMAALQKRRSSVMTDGFMSGAQFQVNRAVGLSPRLDWQVDQNINTTTIGLNASFHFI